MEKAKELEHIIPPFEQIFLKFGSGYNPVIITDHPGSLPAATTAAITAVKINNAQDCIAPKFYAVHQNILRDYLTQLQNNFARLKYGEVGAADADYTALTMTDSTEELNQFRTQFRDYLVTPNAILDPNTRRVDPHIFVFPFSMFLSGEVPLRDHYAPFFILFSYNSQLQLQQMANDRRVRERAMYASLFGDAANPSMWYLRKPFEDNFNATAVNINIFDEESGNFPFGGYGGKASSMTKIHKNNEGQHTSVTRHHPLLFSREVAQNFTRQQLILDPATVRDRVPNSNSQSRLPAVIQMAMDADTAKMYHYGQLILRPTDYHPREHGIQAIREAIRIHGPLYNTFHQQQQPPIQTKRDSFKAEEFYGTPVIDWVKLPEGQIHHHNGVLLHTSPVGRDVEAFNRVRGDLNPHLGYGVLNSLLSDRVNEYHVVNGIWPGIIAQSASLEELMDQDLLPSSLLQNKTRLTQLGNQYLQQGSAAAQPDERALREQLRSFIDEIMDHIQKAFPQGAYIKNYGEFATGDLGIQIKSFHYNAENMINQFLEIMTKNHLNSTLDSPAIEESFVANRYATGARFLYKLLTDPFNILAQARVKIALTEMGFNKEIRVDFLDGEAVSARPRFTHEYLHQEEQEAMEILNRFFARAPEEIKFLSGGADLAQLEDGTWVITELNAGPYSGSTNPTDFPIETNRFITRLQGRDTLLIENLEAAHKHGPYSEHRYLECLKIEEERWSKWSLEDISVAEVARYFRNRHLDQFRKNPTPQQAIQTLLDLHGAFDGVNSELVRDLALLIRGAENYLNGNLGINISEQANAILEEHKKMEQLRGPTRGTTRGLERDATRGTQRSAVDTEQQVRMMPPRQAFGWH